MYDKSRLENADQIALERLWNMTASCPNVTFPEIYNSTHVKDESSIIQKVYFPTLLDWKGISIGVVMLSFIFFESTFLHSTLIKALEEDESADRPVDQKIITKKCLVSCRLSIARFLPVCHIIIFSLLLVAAPFAWLGFIDRFAFIMLSAKGLLIWSWILPLSYVIMNIKRISSYLPHVTDWNEWKAKDSAWWSWLLKSLFSLDSMVQFFTSFGTIAIIWMAVWPLSHTFYNGNEHHKIFSDLYTSHIYIVNMIFHMSVSFVFLSFNFLDLLRSPPIADKTYNWLNSFICKYSGKSGDKGIALLLSLFSVVVILSIVIALFRIFWFSVINRACVTYYGMFIMSFFTLPIVALPLLSIQLVTVNLQREAVSTVVKEDFRMKYLESLDIDGESEPPLMPANFNSSGIDDINSNSTRNRRKKGSQKVSSTDQDGDESIDTSSGFNSSKSSSDDTNRGKLDQDFDVFWNELLRTASILSIFDDSIREYASKTTAENKEMLKASKKKNDSDDGANDAEESSESKNMELCELYIIMMEVLMKLQDDSFNDNDGPPLNSAFTESDFSSKINDETKRNKSKMPKNSHNTESFDTYDSYKID